MVGGPRARACRQVIAHTPMVLLASIVNRPVTAEHRSAEGLEARLTRFDSGPIRECSTAGLLPYWPTEVDRHDLHRDDSRIRTGHEL